MVSLGVKPKPKKTTLFISIPVILVVVVVLLLQFTQSGYLTTVPYRPAFTEISDHVYINQGYAGDRQELLEMIKQAEDRVYEFFGGLNYQEDTIFIISDDEKLTRKLGEDHGTVIVYYPSEKHYICISEEYLEIDILAHEITHAELHARLSTKAQKAIPTWFDEGIALQNDYRERYSEAQWAEQTDNGENAVALEDMDTPAEFYAGEAEDRRFRYLNAKHELNVWMAAYGQQGLLELLEKLNDGADFNTVYGSIDSILLANPAGFDSEPDQSNTSADPDIIRTYETTDATLSEEFIEQEKLVTMVRYYEMTDGTWRTDTNTYKYRLEITGRMGGAAKDSTFVYLSNTEDISFERAYMAAGLSSNMDDYFIPAEAVLVAMK